MTATGRSRGRPRRQALMLFAVAVAVNLLVLYWPRTVGDGGVPHLDKAVHLLVFGGVAWTGLRAGLQGRWLLPLLVLHAALSEVVQAEVLSARSGRWGDLVADLTGVLAGAASARASWRDGADVRS